MIKLENLSKNYNGGKANEVKALKNINLSIQKGEMLAIVGASGAGKSTLLHILGGLSNITSGKYLFNGNDIGVLSESAKSKFRNQKIGIVMQSFALIDEYTVLQNVCIPLYFRKGVKDKQALALNAIQKVGISHLKDKVVSELSGGEKQRCAIARCLCQNPEVILADEPTGQLDSENAKKILDILCGLNEMGITVIIVTHDEKTANRCKRIITLSDGIIVCDSFNSPLQ